MDGKVRYPVPGVPVRRAQRLWNPGPPRRTRGAWTVAGAPPELPACRTLALMTSGLGAFGENYAVGRLGRLGYQILERNVRFRSGEIDIVAREGSDLVFVEVKCRQSSRFGSPESSITRSRFGRLSNAIGEYLSRDGHTEQSFRVDVVAIELDTRGRVKRCDVLKGVAPPPE